MVFSSLVFISIFMPVVLILYRLFPSIRMKNALLLLASLFFYAYGEPVYVFLMIASAAANYIWALLLCRFERLKKTILTIGVIQNLGVLCVYKYAAFLVGLFNDITGMNITEPAISLPIGISFFTFQAMSYVFDVYRGETEAQRNYLRLLLYISFFPQLIAGPIVKYHDIDRELLSRNQELSEVARGIRRFTAGLGKKVLIANYMGSIADALFTAQSGEINALGAWLGAVAYMLQIYFDFSGYSDMAIGLGWMFGFHFKENFNYPYISTSIREFWQRWHISLSGWFKEYLYIPLGGNRKGRARTVVNKFIVFACTGIWHGANLTFLFWGLYHGFFLMLEEYVPFIRKEGGRVKRFVGHVYVVLVVMIGFVFFRADDMSQGVFWVKTMFTGFNLDNASMRLVLSLLTPVSLVSMAAGIIASAPFTKLLEKRQAAQRLSWAISPVILVLCMMCLAGGTYNPFIYFRF